MEISVQNLTEESFAPFGQIIEMPTTPPAITGPNWQWWPEIAVVTGDEGPYSAGYFTRDPGEFSFDWAERHMLSLEVLIPLTEACLVHVAPADFPEQPDHLANSASFQVFRVNLGQAVVLNFGVWHGAPFAVSQPISMAVFLRQHTGRDDTYVANFPDMPVKIIT